MKHFIVSIILCILMATGVALGAQKERFPTQNTPAICTYKKFPPFSNKVWNISNWDRKKGKPKPSTIQAYRNKLSCAPPKHRKAMKKRWRKDKKAYYKYRNKMLFRVNITPYWCGNGWWATQCDIPLHESGYGSGGGNLYGLLDAWYVHGCTEFAPNAWAATIKQQHICASRHWAAYGRGGWPGY